MKSFDVDTIAMKIILFLTNVLIVQYVIIVDDNVYYEYLVK